MSKLIPTQKPKAAVNKIKQDVYLEDTEKTYHALDKMKSISVLKNEMDVCDKIVKYKLDNQFDDEDIWESKKDVAKVHQSRMINIIRNQGIDLNQYRILLKEELDYENKLLTIIAKDKKLKPYEIPDLTERIQTRIKLIQNELAENVDDDNDNDKEDDKEENDNEHKGDNNSSSDSVISQGESIKVNEFNNNDNKKAKNTNKKESNKANQNRIVDSFNSSNLSDLADSIPIEPKQKQSKISKTKKDDNLKQPPKEINQQLLNELEDKFEQYKRVIKYFEDNYYGDKAIQDAISKAKILKDAINKVKECRDGNIEPFLLPKKISPEYICGYSQEERNKKFNEITTEYTKQKNDLQKQIDYINGVIRNAPPNEQSRLGKKYKDEINTLTNEKDKLETVLKSCRDIISNPWIPAPLFSVVNQEDQIEKINENIPYNAISIYLGAFNYNKRGVYAEIELENNKHTIKLKSKTMFDKETTLQFEPEVFKNIYQKTLQIGIYKAKLFTCGGELLKGGAVINLEQLASNNEISIDCQIELRSKRTTPILKLKIQVRSAFVNKEYTTKMRKVFKVQKCYPPFQEKTELQRASTRNFNLSTIELPQNQMITLPVTSPQRKKAAQNNNIPSNRSPIKKSARQQQPISSTKKIDPIKENALEDINIIIDNKDKQPMEKIDKAQFTEAELDNPDCINNFNSLEVLEYKSKEYTQKMLKIDGKTPKELRLKFVQINAKKKMLTEHIQNQEISIEDYCRVIKKQFDHDKLLYNYFKQENNKEKMIMLAPRLRLLIKEIKDTTDLIKGTNQ